MNSTRLPTRQVPVVVRSCSHLIVTQPSRYNFGARSVHKRDHTGRRWPHVSRNWATMPTVETAEAPGTSGIDTLLEKLSSKKAEWARLPVENKIGILREVRQRLLHQPVAWAKASAQLVKRDSSEVSAALPSWSRHAALHAPPSMRRCLIRDHSYLPCPHILPCHVSQPSGSSGGTAGAAAAHRTHPNVCPCRCHGQLPLG